MNELSIGIFGKIPAHGDFIERHIPRSFLTPWDEWLQRGISSSKELLGEQWLEIYLTSPIWRFAASPGVLDRSTWVGIMVPSVDSVGRYFPLTIARPLNTPCNVFSFISDNSEWYQSVTDSALGALQTSFNAEQLLNSLSTAANQSITVNANPSRTELAQDGKVGFYKSNISESYNELLYDHWASSSPSFSLWSCAGSERMPPSSFVVSGLPSGKQYAALLDGNWAQWGT